mgnify:CR=1 FL=1
MGGRWISFCHLHVEQLSDQYQFRRYGFLFTHSLQLLPKQECHHLLGHAEVDVFSKMNSQGVNCIQMVERAISSIDLHSSAIIEAGFYCVEWLQPIF